MWLSLEDSLIIGHLVPVGSTTLLVTLFVGFLIGMGSGVNVCVAHTLGARDEQRTIENVHTSLLLCALMGLLMGTVCFFFSEWMLMLLHTKDDLLQQANALS